MLSEEHERNPRAVSDLRNEIDCMLALQHPHIVQYIASGSVCVCVDV
jgi:hypothetical protein